MGLKIAIIGMSPSKKEAPLTDPEWEKWGLPWDNELWVYMDRLFELHDIEDIRYMGNSYLEKIRELPLIYMIKSYYKNVEVYPIEDVIKEIGDYFNSSLSLMLGLAIVENPEEIALYGIDMTDEPYQHQRPNMEYLIGIARGKGIKVTIHESSPLCKYTQIAHYKNRYGYVD